MQFGEKLISKMLETEKIPSTLLFGGVGSETFAEEFALKLAIPIDIHHYRTEGKSAMHSMESMQQLIAQVYLPPYSSKYKVFIIYDAHRMLPTSSNALLKTLEEPISDTIILLTTSEPKALLPTITSRCTYIPFFPALKELPPKEWEPHLIKFLSERDTDSFSELDAYFTDLKELEDSSWHKEVDCLLEQVFLYYRKQPQICLETLADLIEECRVAVQLHIKLKNLLEYIVLNLAV